MSDGVTVNELANDEVRQQVRDAYSEVAKTGALSGCCQPASSCCGDASPEDIARDQAMRMGYTEEDLGASPDGANMGLGCGNPGAIASLKRGERVLDLGSGGGFDAFLAAREVGDDGHVVGVDMTPDMLAKARKNANDGGFENVEFRLGEIENLPLGDCTVDVIISNCVINLSPNKQRVFEEALRVLAPGGRLAVSDVVATAAIPAEIRDDSELFCACIGGAVSIDELESMMKKAGFGEISITAKDSSREVIKEWAPGRKVEDFVISADIKAVKAKPCCCS